QDQSQSQSQSQRPEPEQQQQQQSKSKQLCRTYGYRSGATIRQGSPTLDRVINEGNASCFN
ncbi:hypothetical protein, partial [Pseudomonas lactucae]|uniref:hypothetical protein n=1 Tax=Pseudomonas lactucae TaxID=2813360 RepID=UPI001967602F